jgi:hypothetical protein
MLPQFGSNPSHTKTAGGYNIRWNICIPTYALWSCTGSRVATVHDGYCAGPGAGGTGQVVLRRRVSARHVLETELA